MRHQMLFAGATVLLISGALAVGPALAASSALGSLADPEWANALSHLSFGVPLAAARPHLLPSARRAYGEFHRPQRAGPVGSSAGHRGPQAGQGYEPVEKIKRTP